ncbi:MAG TPA: hypothetical protein DC042_05335 [Bacteroidales bacterium]|nr:hypothetical protein [Bacteroidales bacterium]
MASAKDCSVCTVMVLMLLIVILLGCSPEPPVQPVARVSVFPAEGDSLTVFQMDGFNMEDFRKHGLTLRYRWDTESDGIWETPFSFDPRYARHYPGNGIYKVTLEIESIEGLRDTATCSVIVRDIIKDSVITDERDGNRYKVAYIYNFWWMSEELRIGYRLEPSSLPTDNDIPEYYSQTGNESGNNNYTAYYTWNELTYYGRDSINGICPPGWRLPNINDFRWLINHKWLTPDSKQYLGPGGLWGTDIKMTGAFVFTRISWTGQGIWTEWWINPAYKDRILPEYFTAKVNLDYRIKINYTGNRNDLSNYYWWKPEWGVINYDKLALPVRCVKKTL